MPTKPANMNFTARDMEILALAWQCFDDTPRINWQKLAELASFKNVETARACFAPIKKKLSHATANGDAGEEAHANQATTRQTKRKPTKQMTPSPKKSKVGSRFPTGLEDDDEEKKDVKPKRRVPVKRVVKVEKFDMDEDQFVNDEA
ncbi:hypothetical protein F4818DRAFT_441114 [Hypoxylon cercidicola]|nr:hypothetical protein F4818DRAFT_441114 [Hypoxylon cercidicola]